MTTEWDRDVRSFFRTLVRRHPGPSRTVVDLALMHAIELADEAAKARARTEVTIHQDFADFDPERVATAFQKGLAGLKPPEGGA